MEPHVKNLVEMHQKMSADDRQTFDRWMKTNLILGSVLAGGLILMSLAGSHMLGPREAAASSAKARELADHKVRRDIGPLSGGDRVITYRPDRIPLY